MAIPNVVVSAPSQLFTLPNSFAAIAGGSIYIGQIGTDPTVPANQIQVYVQNDEGGTTAVSQPISIGAGGYPEYNGEVAKFVTVEGQSMAVLDANGVQVYYFPDILKYDPDQFKTLLSDADGLKYIGRCPSIDALRSIEPTAIGQKIDVVAYYNDWQTKINPTGGGCFFYDAADSASPDDGWICIVTTEGNRWKRIVDNLEWDLEWAGVRSGDNISPLLQTAINLAVEYVENDGFYHTPRILIPCGDYLLLETISMPSYINVIAKGNVTLDVSNLESGYGIIIGNSTNVGSPTYQSGETLSAVGGTLSIIGPSRTGNVHGIYIGNAATGFTPCRNVKLSNVGVRLCNRALEFSLYDTYLFSARDCHFETNAYSIFADDAGVSGSSVNSGERMVFINCIFGSCGSDHIYVDRAGFDFVIDNCSLDYSGSNVINLGPNARYFSGKIVSSHIEAFGDYVVNGDISAQGNVCIYFTNAIFLAVGGTGVANSISRPLFFTNAQIVLNGYEHRATFQMVYNDIPCLAQSSTTTVFSNGAAKIATVVVPSYAHILNKGYDFSSEIVGATVSSTSSVLNAFTISSISAMTGSIVSLEDNTQALQMTGTSSSSFITLFSSYFPAAANNLIGAFLAVQMLSSTGNLTCGCSWYWYDKDLSLLSNSSGGTTGMGSVFSNTSLPNYSLGNIRKIACYPFTKTAPAGSVYCRIRFNFSACNGTANIINCTAFKVE